MHIIMLDKGMSAKDKEEMFKKIDDVDGVKWTLGMNSLVGAGVPDSMIPDDVKSMLESDDHELVFVCSEYESATDEVNSQIAQIDKIVKKYDDTEWSSVKQIYLTGIQINILTDHIGSSY